MFWSHTSEGTTGMRVKRDKAQIRLSTQSLNTLRQNFACQSLKGNASFTGKPFQLSSNLWRYWHNDFDNPPLFQVQNDFIGWSFQKIRHINLLPKFSFLILTIESRNGFSFRHDSFALLPFETAQLFLSFRLISRYHTESILAFQCHHNHQFPPCFCSSKSNITALAAWRWVSAVNGWVRLQSLQNFFPMNLMFSLNVFFSLCRGIDAPDVPLQIFFHLAAISLISLSLCLSLSIVSTEVLSGGEQK